jgi:predicted DNA-binding transcriptional regulator AlpA
MHTDRRLVLSEVLDLMKVGKTRWYKGVAAGDYPPPIKDGSRSSWPASEIMQLAATGRCRPARSQTAWRRTQNQPSQ